MKRLAAMAVVALGLLAAPATAAHAAFVLPAPVTTIDPGYGRPAAVGPAEQPARTTAWIATRVSCPPDAEPHPVAAPIATRAAITSEALMRCTTRRIPGWFPKPPNSKSSRVQPVQNPGGRERGRQHPQELDRADRERDHDRT